MNSVLLLGFLIGIRHAFEPDHIAAVASLTSRITDTRQAIRHGAVWGIGHTSTLFLVCGVVLTMNAALPAQVSAYLEIAVGAMLVVFGLDVIRRVLRERLPAGLPFQRALAWSKAAQEDGRRFPLRSLLVGLMHGMAGSAALIVLAAQTAETPALGLMYVALFGIGSTFGMALFSAAICVPLRHTRNRPLPYHSLQALIGSLTAGLGIYIMVTTWGG